jgi:hypothetical protein
VKLYDIIDLYERRNGKFELNNKQSAIFSLGHFGGQFDWPDARITLSACFTSSPPMMRCQRRCSRR